MLNEKHYRQLLEREAAEVVNLGKSAGTAS